VKSGATAFRQISSGLIIILLAVKGSFETSLILKTTNSVENKYSVACGFNALSRVRVVLDYLWVLEWISDF
jgi:hypothetical protein